MPITSSDVAAFVAEAKPGPRALSAASTAVLDTVAVLIAGSVEDATVRIASTLKPELGGNSFPSFDPAVRVRPDDAALLYGTAAHALDFDDVSMLAICHPSAPVLAALLATGNWVDLTGQQLCEAHVIGTEVMIRMGQAIGFHHYDLGFHSTATMGIFGATAAVARLRRLDREQTGNALAIAASLASGLRLNFGSMIKPVHVGVAAANALRAVEWASAGVEASRGDLFGPGGVFEAMSGGSQVTWPDDVGLGQPFAIEAPGFERKRYACCYLLHKIIALGKEASLRGMRLSEIAGFRVEMPVGGTRPLIHPFPRMGTQAMFSAPYALIAAILDGDIGFDSFDDRSVARPEIQSRLADVLIEEVAGPALTPEQIGAAPVRLELQLTDGSSVRFERFAAPGSPADPLSPEDLEAKWIDCLRRANPSLPPIDASALYAEGVAVTRSGSLEPWLENVWSAARPNAAHSVRAVSA
ncbi:MAG: MmgE/PrpD family protein [Bradyrhizobium sp.]|nr:MmgE/PrpD family protein [Bradyrhizobium sp.]